MKNLLLFALLISLKMMVYGQSTATNQSSYNSPNSTFDSIGTEEYWNANDVRMDDQMQAADLKFQRDSLEWYAVAEARIMAIKVYPNPSRGQIYVDGLDNRNNELWVVQLVDLDGRLIYSAKLDPNQRNINLPDVSVGNYIIRFVHGNTVYPVRITIF